MSEQNTAAIDSTDFDEFKRAVEAHAKGELPLNDSGGDDGDFGDEPDNGSNTGNDDGGDGGGDGGETAEAKAAREAAEKAEKDKAARAKETPEQRRERLDRRIAEFRRATTEAQEIAEIEAAEAERLRRENEELRKKLETGGSKDDKPGKKTYERLPNEPDPASYEFGVIDPAYQRDLTAFFVEKQQKDAQAAAQERNEQATMQQKFIDIVARGLDKHDDYLQVVVETADQGKWRLTPTMAQVIFDSDIGDDVAYHLAKNPAEAAEIADMPPHRQAAAIGRLEARLVAAAPANGDDADDTGAQSENQPLPKNATKAPPPPKKQDRGATGEFTASPDTKDLNAYRRLVEKHQQRK